MASLASRPTCWLRRALASSPDHLVHLVAQVALFANLNDQLSDFVVEFVFGWRCIAWFSRSNRLDLTLLSLFVNHFTSLIEKIFEFCHASSHSSSGEDSHPPAVPATNLPHLILHGRFSVGLRWAIRSVYAPPDGAEVGCSLAFDSQGPERNGCQDEVALLHHQGRHGLLVCSLHEALPSFDLVGACGLTVGLDHEPVRVDQMNRDHARQIGEGPKQRIEYEGK